MRPRRDQQVSGERLCLARIHQADGTRVGDGGDRRPPVDSTRGRSAVVALFAYLASGRRSICRLGWRALDIGRGEIVSKPAVSVKVLHIDEMILSG